jgi:hypothetical protein
VCLTGWDLDGDFYHIAYLILKEKALRESLTT